jgi:hypothetical protein
MRPSEPWSSSLSPSSRPSLSSLATSTAPSSVVGSAADEAATTSTSSPPTSEDGGGISPFASPSVSPPRGGPAFSSSKYSASSSSRSMGSEGKRFEEEAALALAAEEGTLRIPPMQQQGGGGNNHSLRNAATAPASSARRSAEMERGGGGPTARTRAFASNATSEPTWDDVLSRAKLVLKQWKRVYETEGLTGYVCADSGAQTREPCGRESLIRPSLYACSIANDIRNRSLFTTRQTLRSAPASSPLDSLRTLFAVIPPRRRFLLLATVTLIALFLLLSPSDAIGSSRRLGPGRGRRGATAAKSYEVLKSSSSAALALVPEGYPPSANKAKILESRSNPYGFMVSTCVPVPRRRNAADRQVACRPSRARVP